MIERFGRAANAQHATVTSKTLTQALQVSHVFSSLCHQSLILSYSVRSWKKGNPWHFISSATAISWATKNLKFFLVAEVIQNSLISGHPAAVTARITTPVSTVWIATLLYWLALISKPLIDIGVILFLSQLLHVAYSVDDYWVYQVCCPAPRYLYSHSRMSSTSLPWHQWVLSHLE